MRNVKIGLALVLGFVGGCATATVASNFAIPVAHAQDGRKWDYLCFEQDHAQAVMERAKVVGRQGWELVTTGNGTGTQNNVWCFKRPL